MWPGVARCGAVLRGMVGQQPGVVWQGREKLTCALGEPIENSQVRNVTHIELKTDDGNTPYGSDKMRISISLEGTSPLLMHNPQMVDPEFEINRQIKALTSKRKKTDDDLRQIEKLEWYGGIYLAQNGHGPEVVQPTSKIRKCLINTAKISKLGKSFERALSFTAMNVPLTYDGPKDIDKLWADVRFRSRLSVGLNGTKRVMRCRPQFFPWSMTVGGIFVEDAGLNFDELERVVELAGIVEGIGDNRVNGYGRFIGKVMVN